MSGFDNTSYTVRTVTTTTSTLTNNDFVTIWTNTSAKTCNLPAVASVQPGRRYIVVNAAAGDVTVDPAGAETIDGAASHTVPATVGRVEFINTGTAWFTLNEVAA